MPEQCPAIVRVHLQYQQIGLERPDELHLPMRAMRTGHHARYPVPALLGRVERFAEHKVVIDPAIGTQLVLVATGHLAALRPVRDVRRSEEHTYALQSLMRHPYAVCCLKKK